MAEDEVDSRKWDAWDKILSGLFSQISGNGKRSDETLKKLYELAVELRDKLRYSHGRIRSLKQELSVTSASARSERQEALSRLRELESEVTRLASAVQAQGSTLAAREAVAQAQAAENDQLRRQLDSLQRQLGRVEEDRSVTARERNEALQHLDRVSRLLEETEHRSAAAIAEHDGLLNELAATKGRLADVSALETLYGAARDELDRLDKENLELKDMVASGAINLGRSRILEALGIPDTSDMFVSARGRSKSPRRGRRRSSSSAAGRSHSAPRAAGVPGGRRALALPGGGGRPSLLLSARGRSPYARGSFVPDLIPASADAYRAGARAASPGRPRGSALAAAASQPPGLEDTVSDMAFLGPPSSAYPPDPENYVFYRVGGGYSPKLDPHQPTIPMPRASGWVPKDVVRLVQAFRHSYGLALEWRFWEPLVLMIDEVYRSRADGNLGAMRAAQRDKLRSVTRQLKNALSYPSAVAHGKVAHLQRQLVSARKVLAAGDRKGDVALKQMAVKDYHLGYQLDRAVEENFALRQSLGELEHLYSAAVGAGEPQQQQHTFYPQQPQQQQAPTPGYTPQRGGGGGGSYGSGAGAQGGGGGYGGGVMSTPGSMMGYGSAAGAMGQGAGYGQGVSGGGVSSVPSGYGGGYGRRESYASGGAAAGGGYSSGGGYPSQGGVGAGYAPQGYYGAAPQQPPGGAAYDGSAGGGGNGGQPYSKSYDRFSEAPPTPSGMRPGGAAMGSGDGSGNGYSSGNGGGNGGPPPGQFTQLQPPVLHSQQQQTSL